MDIEDLKKRLRKYRVEDLVVKYHAEIQAYVRGVDIEEVKQNILNPEKLVYAREQESRSGQKYDCYFAYSKHLYHRYALVLNGKIIIVTIIKINRDWQKAVERKR